MLVTEQNAGNSPQPTDLRIATVGSYNSTSGSTLIFDGESAATEKRYKRLYNMTFSAGQRVLVAKVSGTYVILGRIY